MELPPQVVATFKVFLPGLSESGSKTAAFGCCFCMLAEEPDRPVRNDLEVSLPRLWPLSADHHLRLLADVLAALSSLLERW